MFLCSIWREYIHDRNQEIALRTNGVIVKGFISDVTHTGTTAITVSYTYQGKPYDQILLIAREEDTLKVGERVLIRIPKNDPDSYFKILHKIGK